MKLKYLHIVAVLSVFFISCEKQETKEIDLSGGWSFQIDSLDQGVRKKWFMNPLNDSIQLPGSMAENGKGNEISVSTKWTGNMWNDSLWYKSSKATKYREKGNIKIPFWLSPKKTYYGPAWYKKTVTIPENWKEKQIFLFLERPHWETTLWVNDQKVGMQNTLATPHEYKLTQILTPGEHTLTIRIDNRIKDINVGKDAHSISDNTQTNWNGIVGDIKLMTISKIALGTIQLYPDVTNKELKVKGMLKTSGELPKTVQLTTKATSNKNKESIQSLTKEIAIATDGSFEMIYPMGESPMLWDEFSPNLYTLSLELETGQNTSKKEIVFGMRDFTVEGKHFSINGRPVFLRGTLECSIFPLTGYPATDAASWKHILKVIQSYGLNHMRFHSWCPPEAAFQAADELGVYLQVEASAWTKIGDGEPIDEWIYKEAESIINNYGNHPSFVMMAYGNEPSGKNQNQYLSKFVDYMKQLDNRRLYTSGAGWPLLDNIDFYNHKGPRIQGWAQGLNSIINARPPQTEFDYTALIQKTPMPYVSHEMGQWCVFPNFKEMSKYTGVLKPKNFEIFKESLEENHLGHLADSLLLASGKLQVLCYKADIEAALRTKDMAGFQLLDLHDFPGQGTALVGVLDAFWDEKGYVTSKEFRKFNDVTVPLVRLKKRIFLNNETLKAQVEVAHFDSKSLKQTKTTWKLTNGEGDTFSKGSFKKKNIPIGNGTQLGEIDVDLNDIEKAQKLTLAVTISDKTNTWDVWVYPLKKETIAKESEVRVVDKLNASTLAYLNNGGKVLLNVSKGDVKPEKGGDIGVGFSSIFWNTSWTKGQKPHTMGILCNPEHPALNEFPTEYHSNWQWWDAMSHSNAIVLDEFSADLKPIVRIVDDWFQNRRTALIFEVQVGKGKLLVSGVDLHSSLKNRPEARQLRYSLVKYMASDLFNPNISLKEGEIKNLFVKK
ncbi:sugar-binding domain-containing protein [Spongiivirga citrea]|uniref:Beta-galactosidase n=1 Tax=Spongiivirga citrea TaxID=1481457 RepID=A0A6M0CLK6_9FLAO|nr:sugar-binding domain-containing protein [Spongiivirga citrea]NER17863.1 beta-galactosidase [Spongiivirga citrea]